MMKINPSVSVPSTLHKRHMYAQTCRKARHSLVTSLNQLVWQTPCTCRMGRFALTFRIAPLCKAWEELFPQFFFKAFTDVCTRKGGGMCACTYSVWYTRRGCARRCTISRSEPCLPPYLRPRLDVINGRQAITSLGSLQHYSTCQAPSVCCQLHVGIWKDILLSFYSTCSHASHGLSP